MGAAVQVHCLRTSKQADGLPVDPSLVLSAVKVHAHTPLVEGVGAP
jgi:hypothetical protein